MMTPKAPCTMPVAVWSTLDVMSGRFCCSHCVTALMFWSLITDGNWCWRLWNQSSAPPLLTQLMVLFTSCVAWEIATGTMAQITPTNAPMITTSVMVSASQRGKRRRSRNEMSGSMPSATNSAAPM